MGVQDLGFRAESSKPAPDSQVYLNTRGGEGGEGEGGVCALVDGGVRRRHALPHGQGLQATVERSRQHDAVPEAQEMCYLTRKSSIEIRGGDGTLAGPWL